MKVGSTCKNYLEILEQFICQSEILGSIGTKIKYVDTSVLSKDRKNVRNRQFHGGDKSIQISCTVDVECLMNSPRETILHCRTCSERHEYWRKKD